MQTSVLNRFDQSGVGNLQFVGNRPARVAIIQHSLCLFENIRCHDRPRAMPGPALEERFRAAFAIESKGSIHATLRHSECPDDLALPTVARVDQLSDGQSKHPQTVRAMRTDRMTADKVCPALLVAPNAENIVNGCCTQWHKW